MVADRRRRVTSRTGQAHRRHVRCPYRDCRRSTHIGGCVGAGDGHRRYHAMETHFHRVNMPDLKAGEEADCAPRWKDAAEWTNAIKSCSMQFRPDFPSPLTRTV